MATKYQKQLRELQDKVFNKTQAIIQPSIKLNCMNVHKLKDLQTCDRLYFWKWIMNLEPTKMSLPFWFGTMVHKAMEDFVQGVSLKQINKNISKESKIFISRYSLMPEAAEELDLQLRIIKAIVSTYFKLFGKKVGKHVTKAVEQSFKMPFIKTPVIFLGTIDWHGTYKAKLAIKEYKTASIVNNEYFAKLLFDKQLNGYAMGYKELTGKYPQICPYTVFRKPQIRCRQNETPDQFIKRLKEDLVTRADWYFLQEDVTLSKQMIENVKMDIEWKVFDLFHKYEVLTTEQILDPYNWSRNDGACFNYGVCPYFNLCRNSKSFHTFLPMFQMREIRYKEEQEELGQPMEIKPSRAATKKVASKDVTSKTKKKTKKRKVGKK